MKIKGFSNVDEDITKDELDETDDMVDVDRLRHELKLKKLDLEFEINKYRISSICVSVMMTITIILMCIMDIIK